MNRPKNQHWAPQFYLCHFATPETRDSDKAQAWIFSRDESDGKETLTNIRNICAKRYLYSPISEAGNRVWDLDSKLERLETTMSSVWPALAEDHVDLGDQVLRKGLSLFVALMHLRNPETLREIEDAHRRLVQFFQAMPTKRDGSPDVERLEIDGASYPLDTSGWHDYQVWGRNDHHRFFSHLIQSEAVGLAEILMKKRWSVVIAETDTFITTDKPVVKHHMTKPSFGFRTEGVVVVFPLSPTRILLMDDMHHEPANQYYPLLEGSEGAFNFGMWRNGSRFMVTGRAVHDVLSEIVRWADAHERRDA